MAKRGEIVRGGLVHGGNHLHQPGTTRMRLTRSVRRSDTGRVIDANRRTVRFAPLARAMRAGTLLVLT